jgi:AP endonuclease-1
VVGVYVPNSGDKLQRLDFRVKVWDRRLEQHLQALEANHNKPVILCGDLNGAQNRNKPAAPARGPASAPRRSGRAI